MRFLTLRSAAIGMSGVALLCAVTPYNDYKLQQTYLYGNHLPVGCLFLFTVLVLGLNTLVRSLRPRSAMSQGEMLTVWAMLITGAGLASSGLMRYLGPVPIAAYYYAGPGNHWADWNQYMPHWLTPSQDPKGNVIKWFFEGKPQSAAIPWEPWVPTFFAWAIVFLLLVGLSICLCALVRKQWVDRERLVFPLVLIPMEMTKDPEKGLVNSFFRSKLMWMGVGVCAIVHSMNGLHSYWFAVPRIPTSWEVWPLLTERPWSSMGLDTLTLYFSAIGIGYLLPSDISFSIWTWYVIYKLIRVLRVTWGIPPVLWNLPNHESGMSVGAFIVWGMWMAWVARSHLAAAWRSLVSDEKNPDDSSEPLPLRAAAMGSVICFLGLVLWTHVAGVSTAVSLLLWSMFVLILVILTRIVAESGLLMVQTPFNPTEVMTVWPGTHLFNSSELGPAIMTQTVFVHDPREVYMPSAMNALRLKGESSGRGIVVGMVLATLVGFAVSYVSYIHLSYTYGGVNLDLWGDVYCPLTHYNRINTYLQTPTYTDWSRFGNIAIGGGLSVLMLVLRKNFLWWGLQPIGLAMAPTYAVLCIWPSMLVAWLCKRLAMAGGYKTYRALLPFFLGLVLGDALMAGIWVIVGMITGVGVPCFTPN